MGHKPETLFRTRVRKKLESLPNSWWESIQQKSIIGTPDILGCCNGTFIALELKARKDAIVSEMQVYKLKKIANSGGIALVLHPENWDSTFELLQHMAEKKHD